MIRQLGYRGYYDGNSKKRVAFFRSAAYMFYAYVIRSLKFPLLYKGHCENIDERLKQHNSGMTKSIRPYIPFELVYKEEFQSREEAIEREKYFKTARGRKFLKTKITQPTP